VPLARADSAARLPVTRPSARAAQLATPAARGALTARRIRTHDHPPEGFHRRRSRD